MSRLRSKISRRIMAVALSVAMVMSNTTVAASESAQTEETKVQTESAEEYLTAEVTSSTEEKEESSKEIASQESEAAGTEEKTEEESEASSAQTVTEEETTTQEETTEEETTEEMTTEEAGLLKKITKLFKSTQTKQAYDSSKIDVWDFGAEQLDTAAYNNMLIEDDINAWYEGVEAGTSGKNVASFLADGLCFHDGGYATTHRLRTTNTNLTRYDEKSLTGSDGNTYTGYIYSNKGKTEDVNFTVEAQAGDVITVVAASNGTDSTIVFKSSDGDTQEHTHNLGSSTAGIYKYYAPKADTYKIYSATEKLVVARIMRERTNAVTVSGAVTAPEEAKNCTLVFTNDKTGAKTTAAVTNGKYSVTLHEQYSYSVSLQDANGYIIASDSEFTLSKNSGNKTFDITISGVKLVTIQGEITGLTEKALQNMMLTFEADEIYVPEVTVEGTKYSAKLEAGVTYTISAEGINDYELAEGMSEQIKLSENTELTMEFVLKPVYDITIEPVGASADDLAEAKFTFTNLDEEDYVYSFTGTEGIALRDGIYSIEVTNSGAFVQKLTSNLKVAGAAAVKSIEFDSDITEWNFADASFTGGKYAGTGAYTYNGLSFTNGKSHNNTYLLSGAGTISVPVSGECVITVNACYEYSFYFEEESEGSVGQKTNSTSRIDSFDYHYTGSGKTVEITLLGTSYINSIQVTSQVDYKDTVTVGAAGCDYTSIQAALDAVKAMNRADDQRVTIEIMPGNYEEMLVLDMDNITLKNASANPSTALKNKGVDIDDNAVRITSYYGHGYSYYSMGSDCKWDASILKVNQANGYESFTNPGSGTTAGSYWNATVVITGSGVEAEGIIFENSFNQYVSKKAAEDTIVAQSSAKEGSAARADMAYGDTTVQDKAYVERAAALAIANNAAEIKFDNCKFIGRQDTLYGGTGVTAAFYDCAVYGGTDYIFGPMTAVFAKCDLVFNTSENSNDVGYITAAQQSGGRGYLMYNCTVTSTTPGVDTASKYESKAGYFGRPWKAETGEAVFYNTVIDAACSHWYDDSASLIRPAGWLNTLSGESALSMEYGTYEMAKDVDNQAKRASWATVLTEPKLADGTPISTEAFLGSWDAFAGKDMEIVIPTDKTDNKPAEDNVQTGTPVTYIFDATTIDPTGLADKAALAEGSTFADGYFKSVGNVTQRVDNVKGVTSVEVGKAATGGMQFTVGGIAEVTIEMSSTGSSNTSAAGLVDADGNVMTNQEGITTVTTTGRTTMTYSGLTAGTYKVVSPLDTANNRGARLYTIVVEDAPIVTTTEYSFDATAIDATGVTDKAAIAEGTTYSDGYFKIVGTVTQRLSSSTGLTTSIEVGKALTGALQFTVTGEADLVITMSSTGGSNSSAVGLTDADGSLVENKEGITTVSGTAPTTMTYTGLTAGTYRIASPEDASLNRGARLYTADVTETSGGSRPPRADWESIAAPEITKVTVQEDSILVAVNMLIGYDGADKVTVVMKDEKGKTVATEQYASDSSSCTIEFVPEASGIYTFTVFASRGSEADKEGNSITADKFILPLKAPYISSATNLGGGMVEVIWDSVKEADNYVITVKDTEILQKTEELSVQIEDLTIGKKYTIGVAAMREEEVSKESTITITITKDAQSRWSFAAFGSGVNTSDNGYRGSANEGSVEVYSLDGKGKLVPASTDGLAFYYTEIDPSTTNFTLTATAKINNWTYSNGQEGFGLMAADAVGTNGDASTFWNNSYMASVTKVEYFWDGNAVSDSGDKITMKIGAGSQEKVGVTPDNIGEGVLHDMSLFSTTMTALDTSCADKGEGTYNIAGNYTNKEAPTGTVENLLTEFKLTIRKNNTGYFVSYTDQAGNVTTNKYYDTQALNQIDSDSVYVGFFASRNADVTFEDITFTTIAPEDDDPAEERPIVQVTPSYNIISASVANKAEYQLIYRGNADGALVIKDAAGKEIVNSNTVSANTDIKKEVALSYGANKFTVTFTPDEDYKPGEYKILSSYEPVTFSFTVTYKAYGEEGDSLYVSPEGKSTGNGTKKNPLDIYTAVKYVQAGQTIVLMEGTYHLTSTVKIERGIDGTADKKIYMVADPEASKRPVLDFGGKCAGMILAGNYWYFKGFDVTKSKDAQKGIQLSGSYNVLDQVNTYYNGNTGIQISRYLTTDGFANWPAHNTVLNCTSYGNADKGYEDADGFAAKLTVGDGNVFDGCIAHHNADDGWDLFAKVETGAIGKVVIKNSVAYANGYLEDGTKAGNGNGFKMGGSSITGYHELHNSVAFHNKAKGIDSNSCPDIQVYNSISFNNEGSNVAFYTNDVSNTDFYASGLISFRTKHTSVDETMKLKGTQSTAKVYGTSNYYWDASARASVNSAGSKATAAWFESVDFTGITRNADGSINMNGFLILTDEAKTGASIGGTSSEDVTIGEETNGSSQGDSTSGGSGDSDSGSSSGSNSGSSSDSDSGSSSGGSGSGTTTDNTTNTNNNIPIDTGDAGESDDSLVAVEDTQTPAAAKPAQSGSHKATASKTEEEAADSSITGEAQTQVTEETKVSEEKSQEAVTEDTTEETKESVTEGADQNKSIEENEVAKADKAGSFPIALVGAIAGALLLGAFAALTYFRKKEEDK